MKRPLEPFVPEDKSVRWAMADAWYDGVGITAWTSGEVPWRATSSAPTARQHARLVTRLFVEMEASGALATDERLVVLEIGAGQGGFCANFVRALERDAGSDGQRLRRRLRYLLCDRSEACVRDAAEGSRLAPLVAEGVVVPGLLDVRHPRELRGLEGELIEDRPAAAIANYICCVVPPVVLQRDGGAWRERQVSAQVETEEDPAELLADYYRNPRHSALPRDITLEHRWEPIALETRFPSGGHAAVLEAAVERLPQATVIYPLPFVELIDTLAERMKPGGLVLVSDYGRSERRDLASLRDPVAQIYGHSPAHGVLFALFDALAKVRGWQAARTRNPYRSLHVAALRFVPAMPQGFRASFHRLFVRREPGEDLSDFRDSARAAFAEGQHLTAIRYYRRALRLDPDSPSLRYLMAEACLHGGYHEDAYHHLVRGLRLGSTEQDFEFLLGRVCAELGRNGEAAGWFQRSLEREEHPVTCANLGAVLLDLGQYRDAYRHLARALALRPDYPRATELLERTRDQWIARLLEGN